MVISSVILVYVAILVVVSCDHNPPAFNDCKRKQLLCHKYAGPTVQWQPHALLNANCTGQTLQEQDTLQSGYTGKAQQSSHRLTTRAVPMMAKSRISCGSGLTLALQCRQCTRLVSCGTDASVPTSAAQVPDTPDGKSPPSAFSSGALRITPLLRQANAIAPVWCNSVKVSGGRRGRSQGPHVHMLAARAMTSFARCFWCLVCCAEVWYAGVLSQEIPWCEFDNQVTDYPTIFVGRLTPGRLMAKAAAKGGKRKAEQPARHAAAYKCPLQCPFPARPSCTNARGTRA